MAVWNYNLLDFVAEDEKVILNQTVEIKFGWNKYPRSILLTNKKLVYGDASYGIHAYPLNQIKQISLRNPTEGDNYILEIDNSELNLCSKKEEAVAKKIFTTFLKTI